MNARGTYAILHSVRLTCPTLEALGAKHRCKIHALGAMLMLVLARPTDAQDAVSLPFLLAGLALRIWALGCIHKNDVLCTWGPYRHTRNPLYLANALLGVGLCLWANHWVCTLMALVVFAAIYPAAIRNEEQRCSAIFGDEYSQYCRTTPRFIPRLWGRADSPRGCFRLSHALSQGLVAQTVIFLMFLGAMEAKEEYLELKGIVPPLTYGVLPLSLLQSAPGANDALHRDDAAHTSQAAWPRSPIRLLCDRAQTPCDAVGTAPSALTARPSRRSPLDSVVRIS